ncbi:unnamed protein product [Gadus morhua 'NCC']
MMNGIPASFEVGLQQHSHPSRDDTHLDSPAVKALVLKARPPLRASYQTFRRPRGIACRIPAAGPGTPRRSAQPQDPARQRRAGATTRPGSSGPLSPSALAAPRNLIHIAKECYRLPPPSSPLVPPSLTHARGGTTPFFPGTPPTTTSNILRYGPE